MGAKKSKKSDAAKQWDDKLRALVEPVSEKLDADVLVYAGSLYPFWDFQVGDLLREKKEGPNLLMVLTTYGGSADSAYRLARWVQDLYGDDGTTFLLVDTFCKSAGTLVAIGFEEIIMSPDAEFGPLDVQLRKADEIEERTSGLTAMQAMSTLRMEAYQSFEQILVKLRRKTRISSKIACEVAAGITVGLFAPIYEQMDPTRLGENQRAMLIAEEYGRRLVKRSSSLKDKALANLIVKYPSHEFVIDRTEASDIFQRIRTTEGAEVELADYLRDETVQHCFAEGDDEELAPPFIKFWSRNDFIEPPAENEGGGETETKDDNETHNDIRTGNGQPESADRKPEPAHSPGADGQDG